MTHQVNLHSDDLLPGYGPWQLPIFVLTIGVAILVSAGSIAYAWYERENLLTLEQEWVGIAQNDLAALDTFQREYPALDNEAELTEENEALSGELQRMRETYSGLADQLENAVDGFTGPLKQLSDYDVNGLWLNRISLRDGTGYFYLSGFARRPELIPEYIAQLGLSSFEGISIQNLSVTKEEDIRPPLWRFNLSNTAQATDGGID